MTGRRRRWHEAIAVCMTLLTPMVFFLGAHGGQTVSTSLDALHGQLPPPHPLPSDSMVYDRSGRLIGHLHPPGESRIPVPLSQVAPPAILAIVAVEDRNFWHEGSVAPLRVIVATLTDFVHWNAAQGASTITQQLAKVRYLDNTKSIVRKLRQFLIGHLIARQMTKAQILEEYLNDIDFGHGATGIEAAAQVYFNTSASRLDLAQAALLAGLPSRPSQLDPFQHFEAAKARQAHVLDAMVRMGSITRSEADATRVEELKFGSGDLDATSVAPHFVNRVARQVESQLKLDPYRSGLRITTTLDLDLQNVAQRAVNEHLDGWTHDNVTSGALVSVDPEKGEVRAYVGSAGPGHPGWQMDMTAVPRQPGATFTLFTYATAVAQKKVTMLTPILDAPYWFVQGGGPHGDKPYQVPTRGDRYYGTVLTQDAIASSLYVPAVKLQLLAGAGNVVDTARSLGVTTLDRHQQAYGPILTLGAYPVSLREMVWAGSAFAAGGVLSPERLLLSVRDNSGRELALPADQSHRVLDAGVAFVVNRTLSDDANRLKDSGPLSALTIPGHQAAALTDLTSDLRDGIAIGWTPGLVTGVWIGNADNSPMRETLDVGGTATVWRTVMERGLLDTSDDWPDPPDGVHRVKFGGRTGYVLQGTTPSPVIAGPFWTARWQSPYRRTLGGYDASYPQCGLGLPSSHSFWILGVNYGRAFTTNPCLSAQYEHAVTQSVPSLYVNLGYRADYVAKVTSNCLQSSLLRPNASKEERQAWAIGCSEAEVSARYSAGQRAAYQPAPLMWWLDIETPFPESLAGADWSMNRDLNRQVIAGAIEFFRQRGETVGIYSTSSYWSTVTGDWVIPLPDVPHWVAGVNSVAETCRNPGFSGGPVWLVQIYRDASFDTDVVC